MDFDNPANTGERLTAQPVLSCGLVLFSTLQPSADACQVGGTSFLFGLAFGTGSQDGRRTFDTSGDSSFDANDVLASAIRIESTVGSVSVVSACSTQGAMTPPVGPTNAFVVLQYTSGGRGAKPFNPGGGVCDPATDPNQCTTPCDPATDPNQCTTPNPGSFPPPPKRITWKELISQ